VTRTPPVIADFAASPADAAQDVRGVLRYPAFRRLWIALSLSSLGDWLGLLATTALASDLVDDDLQSSTFAIGGVLIFRLLPAVLIGPFAGVLADRFDRRRTMVVCDIARFAIFASIPVVVSIDGVPGIAYLLVASFLVESVSLLWIPAKEASVPNLVPPEKLEAANQLSLITTYGSAPVAALVFAGLAKLSDALGSAIGFFSTNPVDLALYFDASTFLFSAFTVSRLGSSIGRARREDPSERRPGVFADLVDGWRFIGQTPLARGLVVGILGAFAAGGAVIALGRPFVGLLQGGDAAYGMLFGAVFTGLALGMALGPRLLGDLNRRRMFGLSIIGAGTSLAVESLLPNLVLALFATVAVGGFAGIAWITGYTLLGREIDDAVRGRTFAAVQSLVRVDLLVVLAGAPFLSGVIGDHEFPVFRARVRFDGVTLTLFAAGLLAVGVGLLAYRQMDDGRVSLWRELVSAVTRLPVGGNPHPGLFVSFEGGEGAGKSTQVQRLAEWLRSQGVEVVTTFEPGATATGAAVRTILLDTRTTGLSDRAEALLYAADRAQHVAEVIEPALRRGAVVVTDRYVDSSLAYQGGGRDLPAGSVARLSAWATGGLLPDLTVVLDVEPAVGLSRLTGRADRIESETLEFHERVRATFLDLARQAPARFLVVDAGRPPAEIHDTVREEVARRLASIGVTGRAVVVT
jgi:dTMP kinase